MDDQNKRTARTFDEFHSNYSDAVSSAVAFTGFKADFFTQVKADHILDETLAHFGNTQKVSTLDVGCGIGNYHHLLSDKFMKLSGVDISSASIDQARSKNAKVDYQVYDGRTLPYQDATFDLAFTICVLHHVPTSQWQEFAQQMRRVVRPGGLALVFEHNPLNPFTRKAVNSCPFDEDAVLLRKAVTEKLFFDIGFIKASTEHIFTMPCQKNISCRSTHFNEEAKPCFA
jgi:SAM-dependent methyltransferase